MKAFGARSRWKGPLFAVAPAVLLLAFGSSTTPGQNPFGIHFRDVATDSGVNFRLDNSQTAEKYLIEPMTGGVALFDFDNDGLLDLYFVNGAAIPSLEKSGGRYWNRLYRNLGDFRFEEVTEQAGVAGYGYGMGVAAADFDNDGWTDLYVAGVNRNILYRNRGDGTFEDVTVRAGVEGLLAGTGKVWAVGAGWFDFDNDGHLDLFVVNYVQWSPGQDPPCGLDLPGYRTYCHPRLFQPLANILYRNNGDGTFTDVSRESGIGAHPGKGMAVAFADYDRDGLLDIFVTNDTVRSFLFRNRGEGRFEEVGLESGVAYPDTGVAVSGMGADFQDYDGDGWPDVVLTALSNETFPLFRNLGNGLFRDETFASGLGALSLPWSGWSVGWTDLDNDGRPDLFVAAGHVQTNEELYSGRASRQANRVFRNLGSGRFADLSESCGEDLRQEGLHRGAAFGDLDNDGRVDVVVTRLNQPAEIFRNLTRRPGNWLSLDLDGTCSNRDGLGSRVTLTLDSGQQQVRHASTAVGYASSSDKRLHFGLGPHRRATRLEVVWPSGVRHVLEEVSANQLLHLREPDCTSPKR